MSLVLSLYRRLHYVYRKHLVRLRLRQRFLVRQGPCYYAQTEIIVYGPQRSPWLPLLLVVGLPTALFVWGWSRKYWRQGILDLPALVGQLWLDYGSYGALLWLLPPLGWLRHWTLYWRGRQELHLFWLHIWAHGWAPYGRAHEFFLGPLGDWIVRNISYSEGFLHGYAPLYRVLHYPRRILWGQLALALTELALSGGRLEWFLRALPTLALIYGLARFWAWWSNQGLDGTMVHHIVYDSPLPAERQVELAVFWGWLCGPLAPLLEPYAQSHPGQV